MKLALWTTIAALFVATAGPAVAGDPTTAGEGKGKYLVMVKHTPEECLARMDEVAKNKKLFGKAEWGCMSGDHTMYLTTEAKSPEDALRMLNEKTRPMHSYNPLVQIQDSKVTEETHA